MLSGNTYFQCTSMIIWPFVLFFSLKIHFRWHNYLSVGTPYTCNYLRWRGSIPFDQNIIILFRWQFQSNSSVGFCLHDDGLLDKCYTRSSELSRRATSPPPPPTYSARPTWIPYHTLPRSGRDICKQKHIHLVYYLVCGMILIRQAQGQDKWGLFWGVPMSHVNFNYSYVQNWCHPMSSVDLKGPYPLGDSWPCRSYFWWVTCWYETLECTCLIWIGATIGHRIGRRFRSNLYIPVSHSHTNRRPIQNTINVVMNCLVCIGH